MKVFSLKACLAPLAWLHSGGSWAVSAQEDGTQSKALGMGQGSGLLPFRLLEAGLSLRDPFFAFSREKSLKRVVGITLEPC